MTGVVDPAELLDTGAVRGRGADILAELIQRGDSDDPQNARIRLGVVTAINPGARVVSVRVSGNTAAIAGVPVASAEIPPIGATVVLVQTAGSYVVVGSTTPALPGSIAWAANGPWQAAAPGPTTGVGSYSAGGVFRGVLNVSAYSSVNAGIGVRLYLNGSAITDAVLNSGHAVNQHTFFAVAVAVVIPAGTNYWGIQQGAGTSDGGDRASFSGVITPT